MMIRRSIAAAVLLLAMGLGLGSLVGQSPKPNATPYSPPIVAGGDALKPVAYIHGERPVSQEEFGKFLMDRGGVEKLEKFVNIKIIDEAAKARGLTVTKLEMEAALNEDIASVPGNISKSDFIKGLMPRYGVSFYEWMEDVVRPRILLTKMVRERIKVTDEDLKKQFERRYGEKRKCQMLLWPLGDEKLIEARYANAKKNQDEFDREARNMVHPGLSASQGHMQPITKHIEGEDKIIEETAFKLKEGEVSAVIRTKMGYAVLKLHKIIPPEADKVFEVEKPKLEKAAFDEILTKEIPKFFAELKEQAAPKLMFKAPAEWQNPNAVFSAVDNLIHQAGQNVPVQTPGATPSGLPPLKKQ